MYFKTTLTLLYTHFFFSSRRRHTRCYRDWSSDVCSSDLAVQEAAVVFRKDEDELPKPVACIVTRDGAVGTPELARELQAFVLSRLPVFKRPHWVEFLPELPKTATGKIQRFKLRAVVDE